MIDRAGLLRISRAVRRRRGLCVMLTEGDVYEPTPEQQRAWRDACEEVRRLRAEYGAGADGADAS